MINERPQPVTAEASASTCSGCSQSLTAARCDYCGAAQRAGPYTVERLVDQTAHSRLYLARGAEDRRIALKELHFAAVPGSEQIEAFEREARTLEQLDHPAVPKFFKSFQEGVGVGLRLYLATEFIDGESLATRLTRGPLSEVGLRSLATEALAILVFLQSRSPAVLHRDIKPGNLVFRADGRLALVDFGSVRQVDGSRTHRSTLVGTFGYMPPEQLGGSVGLSTDVYALGATLLHAATGKAPAEWVRPDLSLQIPPQVPAWLAAWLRSALAVDPRKRFHDAAEAARELATPTPAAHVRQVRPAFLIAAAAIAAAALGVQLWLGGAEVAERSTPLLAPRAAVAVSDPSAEQWFTRVRTACNPVEVKQALQAAPPPAGTLGAGYAAGCLALAGKIQEADVRIGALQPNERWRAVDVVFALADPVADRGDDVAAAPMMELVLKYWPEHFQALYHLGLSELTLGKPKEGRAHLEKFLSLYKNPDGFRSNALATLAKLDKAEGR